MHKPMKGNSVSLLWKSFLAGDKEAFAHFYNLHVNALYRYGTKLCTDDDLVKDAIQEVFLDLYLKRNKNKANPENLRFYLILALKRNLIKKLKRNRKLVSADERELIFQTEYSIETTIIENEKEAKLNQRINEMLQILPPGQKEALYLRYNLSLEYDEVARLMNITVESARKQVYRALKAIRDKYGKQRMLWFFIYKSEE